MPLETREIKLFWRDIPGFCRDILKLPEKFEKKSLGSIFVPYQNGFWTSLNQGPLNGGVSNGGVSRSGLVLPFLSFLGLSRFFWDFPNLLGDGPGILPIRPFPLSRPIKSTYEEQSRKGPRHNLDLSRKKWETPGFGNTRAWLLSIKAMVDSVSVHFKNTCVEKMP